MWTLALRTKRRWPSDKRDAGASSDASGAVVHHFATQAGAEAPIDAPGPKGHNKVVWNIVQSHARHAFLLAFLGGHLVGFRAAMGQPLRLLERAAGEVLLALNAY